MSQAIRIWRSQKKDSHTLSKSGTVVSWTRVVIAPPEFQSEAPYFVLLVKLDDGKMIYGQLVDYCEDMVQIGSRVKSVLRKRGKTLREDVIAYGVKFIIQRQ